MERIIYLVGGKLKFAKEADAIAIASEIFRKTNVVVSVEKAVVQHRVRFGHMYSSKKFAAEYGNEFLQQVITCPSYEIVWWHGEFDSLFKVSKRSV